MFKGAVISGTLRDASGQPLAGVRVTAINARATDNARLTLSPQASNAESVTTDDRGAYRIYGLMPGEYAIAALPLPDGTGQIGARSAAEMDALLFMLAQRRNAAAPFAPTVTVPSSVSSPRLQQASNAGYCPIYFPGTPVFAEATRIRVAPGEEREAADFSVSHVPFASIEGRVSGDLVTLAGVELSIIPPGPFGSGTGTRGITRKAPNEIGEFAYGNLPPGRYRIVARARPGLANSSVASRAVSGRGGGGGTVASAGVGVSGPTWYTGEQFFAVADVDVRGVNVKGVILRLAPGGSFSGKVVFDSASTPTPDDLKTISVHLAQQSSSDMSMSGGTVIGATLSELRPVPLRADGTFSIMGIGPASYRPRVILPASLSEAWTLRSAIADDRDLLDTGIEGPNVQLAGVTLILTDRPTELSGTLRTASGQPAAEYFVIVFSTERVHWMVGARRSRSARPDTNGRFAFANLPVGEYCIAALTDLDPMEWQDASFLEQVAPAAVKVSIGEGQKKTQDLRIK
jgi:uncharacterized protein (DUF2141 family)